MESHRAYDGSPQLRSDIRSGKPKAIAARFRNIADGGVATEVDPQAWIQRYQSTNALASLARAQRYLLQQENRSHSYFGAAEFFNCAGSAGVRAVWNPIHTRLQRSHHYRPLLRAAPK